MTITICDICKSQDNVSRHRWTIDRRLDAAGSMEDISEGFDLCSECMRSVLAATIQKHFTRDRPVHLLHQRWTFNEQLIAIIKNRIHRDGTKEN